MGEKDKWGLGERRNRGERRDQERGGTGREVRQGEAKPLG
mgnify:CR=1 FL=1